MKISKTVAVYVLVGLVLSLALGNLVYKYAYSQGFNTGADFGYSKGADFGYLAGQNATLMSIQGFLRSGGVAFNFTQKPDGSYTVTLANYNENGQGVETTASLSAATFEVLNKTFYHKTPEWKVNLYVSLETSHGNSEFAAGNMLTDQFENMTRDVWAFNNGSAWSPAFGPAQWMSCGNATIASSLTTITEVASGGGSRGGNDSVVQWSYQSHSAFNVTKKFTFTATNTIDAMGLYWSAAGNSLVAAAPLPQSTLFNAGDNATGVWVLCNSASGN